MFLTVLSTHYTVQSTLYRLHRAQYRLHSTKYTVQSTQYRLFSTMYTVHSTEYSVQIIQHKVHSTQYKVWGFQQIGISGVKQQGSNPGSLLRSKSTRRDRRCEAASERLVHNKVNAQQDHCNRMHFKLHNTHLEKTPFHSPQLVVTSLVDWKHLFR